ncbi:glutathione S-transferase [Agrocybe pediades]|nr:glutathione S-transferase [Agrocybe pediades]
MSDKPRDTTNQSDVSKMQMASDGSFKRAVSSFRNTIEKGGKHEPERGEYHLYVSYSCPWATRTLIVRKLKGLEDIIYVTAVSPKTGPNGWPFAQVSPFPGADEDPLYKSKHIKDLYLRADPAYTGRFTVPVLWDKKLGTIANNESSEIIRIFNTAFNELLPEEKVSIDLYPNTLRSEIDALNEWVYHDINNGVYKAGFATSQEVYEKAVHALFDALDRVERILADSDFLVGNRLTDADVRLFVTIIRFDPVYAGHFKCNIRTIRDGYPSIHRWLRNIYWKNPAFKDSTNFEHIKTHYYGSQVHVNPNRVIPVGPVPNILPLSGE